MIVYINNFLNMMKFHFKTDLKNASWYAGNAGFVKVFRELKIVNPQENMKEKLKKRTG